MTIPFAVYTAFHGYAWSSIPEGISAERLNDLYRKACAQKPAFLGNDDFIEGVLYDAGTVVAFHVQIVQKWDSVGRSAEYGAFAFPPFDMIRAIDFDSFLSSDTFRVPCREPPSHAEYDGPTSVVHNDDYLFEIYEQGVVYKCDFRAIGDIIFTYHECCGAWSFMRSRRGGAVTVTVGTEPWECIPESWLEKGLVSLSALDNDALESLRREHNVQ